MECTAGDGPGDWLSFRLRERSMPESGDGDGCGRRDVPLRGVLRGGRGFEGVGVEEAAGMLELPLGPVIRRYGYALDEVTEIFLERKLLEPSRAGREAGTIL